MHSFLTDSPVGRFLVVSCGLFATCLTVLLVYQALLIPLCLGFFFAYLLMPVVDLLEHRAQLRRSFCALIVLLLAVLLLGLFVAGLVPLIRDQVISLAELLPRGKQFILERALPWIEMTMTRMGLERLTFADTIANAISMGGSAGGQAFQQVWTQTYGLIGGIFNFVLSLVFAGFLLADWQRIRAFIVDLVPTDIRPAYAALAHRLDSTLRYLLKGQLVVAFAAGCLYTAGFAAVGLKYSLAIGAIVGVCRVVPYLELVVGLTLAALTMITDPDMSGWGVPLGVSIVFVVVQFIDGMFLTPKILGGRVGLHPVVIISSIIAFSYWLGFWGVVVAIPLVATLKVIGEMVQPYYKSSSWYTRKAKGTPP